VLITAVFSRSFELLFCLIGVAVRGFLAKGFVGFVCFCSG